jgi:hypothetical protein
MLLKDDDECLKKRVNPVFALMFMQAPMKRGFFWCVWNDCSISSNLSSTEQYMTIILMNHRFRNVSLLVAYFRVARFDNYFHPCAVMDRPVFKRISLDLCGCNAVSAIVPRAAYRAKIALYFAWIL